MTLVIYRVKSGGDHSPLVNRHAARDDRGVVPWRNAVKHFIRAMALIACTTVGSAAMAEEATNPPTPQSQAAAKAAYSTKPICKRVAVTGSYVKRTVCKTQEQMDREKAAMDQWAQEIRRNGSWNTVNGDH